MDLDRQRRAEELARAVEVCSSEERRAFLEGLAAADPALATEVGHFLETLTSPAPVASEPPRRPATGPPATAGVYVLRHEIGRGGTGSVYLATRDDDQYRRLVAVKMLRLDVQSEELVRRFHAERRILAGIDHPGIAKLIDGGTTDDGRPYLVIEYVEGRPIDQYCDTNGLSIPDRIALFREVCAAVQYAHQNLVVHRDLKPGNIFVTGDGRPKLLDFGIAKLLNPALAPGTLVPTQVGHSIMTPEYASPEQVRGESITTATDIYSLGVILYELLTGRLPYDLPSRAHADVVHVVCEEDPPPPSAAIGQVADAARHPARTGVPNPETVARRRGASPERLRRTLAGDLDNIVLKALRKEPRQRYASVEQLSEDLRRHLEGLPVTARKGTLVYRTGKFVRRHPTGVATGTVLVLALVGFAATMTIQSARIAEARDRARHEAEKATVINRFLLDTLGAANPNVGLGREVTVLQALGSATSRLSRSFQTQPETRAAVLRTIGWTYLRLGRYAEAEPLLREALAIRRAALGSEHVEVAQSLGDLANLLRRRGDYEAALSLARESLEMSRRLRGAEHADVAEALMTLALVLDRKGDVAAAEPLYREALELRRRVLGPGGPLVAESLNDLADAVQRRGRYDEAEALFRESLELWRRTVGEEHPETAQCMNDLGFVLYQKGEYAEAEKLLRQATDMRRRLLGAQHPDVAQGLNNLGRVARLRGDARAAVILYEEALAIRRAALGNEHADVATTLNDIGTALSDLGDWAGAEVAYREALALRRKALGPEHPHIGASLNNLANLLVRRGERREAEELYRESLEMNVHLRGAEHPDTARILGNLAEVIEPDDPVEAERLLRESLAIRRKALGPEHPDVAAAVNDLATFLDRRGRWEEAEALHVEACAIFERKLPPNHRRLAGARSDYGEHLVAMGRYGEAEPVLLAAYDAQKVTLGEGAGATRRSASRLAGLYDAWGKPAKAREYRVLARPPQEQHQERK